MKASAWWLCPLALICADALPAQAYPDRPIRIVVGSPGGSGDISTRLIAPRISIPLGQQVVVHNRAGVVAVETVTKSLADGYTLLLDATSLWVAPLLQNMPYDVFRDLVPITTTDKSPNLLAVNASVPAASVKEFIALAKAKPGALNYGTGAAGSLSHLAAELFKSLAGVDIVRISYKGGALAVTAAISGEVQMVFNSAGSLTQHIKSGKLKPLGVGSPQPSALVPGLPTIAASGVPGFEATLIQGIFAPVKTPEAIVRRLNQEIVRALSSDDMKERYLTVGFEAAPSSSADFGVLVKSEVAKWGKLIKSASIRAD